MDLADAVVEYVDSVFHARYKIQVAEVVAFDHVSGTVDIRLSITTNTRGSDLVIYGVPVCYPSGGTFRLVYPIEPKTQGVALFSDVSLDAWKQTRQRVTTNDNRSDALSDCLFIPSVNKFANIGDQICLQKGDGTLSNEYNVVRKMDLQHAIDDMKGYVDKAIKAHIHTTPNGVTQNTTDAQYVPPTKPIAESSNDVRVS